jgi:CDP-diacylglycerol--glycerol-3-phosphate 3-phosphatidyltransferase
MFRHVPNILTGLRLILAAVFFAMLADYQQPASPMASQALWLNTAFLVYLIALISDFFDGYLARKWKVEGAFGRVVDPFVDKVLVLGSFIFFAGRNFTIPSNNPSDIPSNVMTITGISPWMVVVILARELLVTSLRGSSEQSGQNFAAAFSGKLKMVAQSVTILAVLLYVNYLQVLKAYHWEPAAAVVRNVFIWATLVITVASGLLYVQRAIGLYRKNLVK